MIELGVNIDHVATVRQARKTYEPDPVVAAALAEQGAPTESRFTCGKIVVTSKTATSNC